ncbi:hypothetical protein EG359_02230 [Chryseobacterium joostei]|uniref:Uncharacterized protein n=1 Tax=Chryseobacterium joostei TaxID=112234 RepID=A0A1N7IMD1_9FLAO|nr:hypothetical protein [Chryseobacterium joostei]AZA98492.1 hypothetical protein EG359_02230 [Chryseobacterium joostei]SIS38247.1 hypothetical protein SAMN05421768_10680 [Chryseobacterium joostei]
MNKAFEIYNQYFSNHVWPVVQKHQNQAALELLVKAQEARDLTLDEGIYKEMADNYLSMVLTLITSKHREKVMK